MCKLCMAISLFYNTSPSNFALILVRYFRRWIWIFVSLPVFKFLTYLNTSCVNKLSTLLSLVVVDWTKSPSLNNIHGKVWIFHPTKGHQSIQIAKHRQISMFIFKKNHFKLQMVSSYQIRETDLGNMEVR